MENHACGSCVFFDGNLGGCRFNPPFPIHGFPIVTPKDWCSHFSKEWPVNREMKEIPMPKKGGNR